jgi:hypothetical protein
MLKCDTNMLNKCDTNFSPENAPNSYIRKSSMSDPSSLDVEASTQNHPMYQNIDLFNRARQKIAKYETQQGQFSKPQFPQNQPRTSMKSSPGGIYNAKGVRDRKLSYALFCEKNVNALMRDQRQLRYGEEGRDGGGEGTYDQIL